MIDPLFGPRTAVCSPVRLQLVSRVGPSYRNHVMARRRRVLYMLRAVGRFGLSALVVVVAVSATAVATGRTTVPLRALEAARAAVGLSNPTAAPP